MAFPSSWTQSAWFIDPQNSSGTASDGNTGLTSSTALRTWGEVIARMGTISPALNQLTTFTFLSAQTANTDFIFFTPQLSNGSQAVITALGAATNTGAAFSAGALGGGFGYSGAAPSAGGTPMTIASVPVYVVAGTLLHNTTRNSYAFVDSVAGGTAKVTQPHTAASTTTTTTLPAPAVDNDWAAGDNIQPLTLLSLNVKRWAPVGGDLTAGNQPCAGWIIGASIADSSGTGSAEYPFVSTSAVQVLSLCNVNPRIAISNSEGRTVGCQLISCYAASFVNQFGGAVPQIYGGVVKSGINVYSGLLSFNNNAVIHGSTLLNNGPSTLIIQAGGAFSDGSVTAILGCSIGATGIFWGSYSVTLDPGATYWNVTGSTFAAKALLTTGALSLGANTSGYAASSTGFYGPFPITPSTLDGYNGLQDPLTGAKFFNTSISATLPVNPTSWTQTDWYLDGVNGNDANSGAFGSPVKTIMGGIVAKWGTTSPIIAQTTTIHVLNGQASGLERAILTPILSGTSANFVIVGTPSNIGSTFAAGTVTQLVEGNPGNDLQIANMPVGAAAGVLVFNSTRNSYAIIDSMNGSTATMQQPFSTAALTTVVAFVSIPAGVVWSTGDTLQMSSLPTLNLEVLSPVGGDGNSSFTNGTCWTQMIHIPDVSGTAGDTTFTVNPQGPAQTFSLCNIDPSIVSNAVTSRFQLIWMSCTLSGEVMLNGGFQTLYGGAIGSFGINFSDQGFFGEGGIYRETICHGPLNVFSGDLFVNSLHIIGTLSINAGAALSFGSHPIWGAGSVQSGGVFLKVGAATWASSLLVSSIQINSNSFGYASAGQYTYGPFALTAANLDGYGGLQGGSSPQAVFSNGSASVPTTPVSWTQTDWYLDGYAGNDTTGDGSFSKPVKTIMGGIVSRWGTTKPVLAQTTTIHVLSGQTVGAERTILEPILTGSSTNFVVIGTPSNFGSSFSAGTITTKVIGNPGNDWQVAGMPAGAAAGMQLFNSTRNSYAMVKSVTSNVATITQPVTAAWATTVTALTNNVGEDNGWVAGNTLQLSNLPILNLEGCKPLGGDSNTSFSTGVFWVQQIHVPDISGVPGNSSFSIVPFGCAFATSLCFIDTFITTSDNDTGFGCMLANSLLNGGGAFHGVYFAASTVEVAVTLGPGNNSCEDTTFDCNVTIFGGGDFAVESPGGGHITSGNTFTVWEGCTIDLLAPFWGAGTLNTTGNGYVKLFGGTWATNLIVATLEINGATTGTAYSGNGIFYGPIALTSANLDGYGGLQNPATGSMYGGGTVPSVPASWTQTDWYLDGYAGNDTTGDGSFGKPVKTITGGIISRWGTSSPLLNQTTTIHVLTGQTSNLERAVLKPVLQGQNTNFVIIGTTASLGTTFTAGTVTPKSQGNPGNDLLIATMQAGSAAGDLVFNSTRSSYAFIKSMSGSTATMEQPFTSASLTTVSLSPFLSENNAWATGDTLQRFSVPILNLETFMPVGGDANNSFTGGMSWVQTIRVPDASGSNGSSQFSSAPVGTGVAYSLCRFDASVYLDGRGSSIQSNAYALACHFAGGLGTPDGGNAFYDCAVQGGACVQGTGIGLVLANGAQLLGDIIIDGDLNMGGEMAFLASAGGVHLTSGATMSVLGIGAAVNGPIWGAGSINIKSGNLVNLNGTWTNNLLVASAAFNSITVGYATAGNGITYGPFKITGANLDTYGGLRQLDNAASFGIVSAVPTTPVTWTQSTWYYDPQNSQGTSSDNNSGLTSGTALRTWAGVISKLGTQSPILAYGQSMTFNKLSAHTANTDPVSFTPILSGGGQAVHLDTLVVKSASFTGGAVTARNQTTGQLLAVAGFPAGTAVGDYVFNSTRNSYAVAYTGGTTPTFTTPVPASVVTTPGIPTIAEDNTWTTGDTFIVYTRPLLNLQQWEPVGGDLSGAGNNTASCGWVQWSQIPDSSGAGGSAYLMRNRSAVNVFSGCQFLSRVHVSALGGRGFASYLLNCDCAQAIVAAPATDVMFWGTTSRNSLGVIGALCVVDGGSILHGTSSANAGSVLQIGDGYTDSLVILSDAGILRLGTAQGGATAALWGPGSLTVNGNSQCRCNTGWAATLKLSGALQLGNNTTGYAVASNYIYGPFLITTANLDTYNGLQDFDSNALFYNQAGINSGVFTPLTWTQSTWFIDPTNSQGTSSDNNSGLTSGTSLLTWKGFISKMGGTNSPTLKQTTTVTFLSSHTNNTDPVVWSPIMAQGSRAQIQGTTPTTTAAVFTLSASKSRTAGSNSLLAGSFSAGTIAPGVMIQNTTAAKSSRAFIYKSAGGSNWDLSQPFALQVPPSVTAPTEVDTWASTDTVNVLSTIQVNIASFQPTLLDFDGYADNLSSIYQLTIFDPTSVGFNPCYVNGSVILQEVLSQRFISTTTPNPFEAVTLYNVAANGGIVHEAGVVSMFGGYIQTALQGLSTYELDGDVIIGNASSPFLFAGTHILALVYLDTLVTIDDGDIIFRTLSYGSHVIYGSASGTFEFGGVSHGVMNTGTFTAGWTAPTLVTGVSLNGATTANSIAYSANVGTIHNGITTSVANLDAAAGAAGFGGTAFNLGGASISNLQ